MEKLMMFLDESILCSDLGKIPAVTSFIINIIQIGVPIAIILLGSIDLFKAVIASKEDEIKTAQKLLIKRIIYGLVIFFLTTGVKLIFKTVDLKEDNLIDCLINGKKSESNE